MKIEICEDTYWMLVLAIVALAVVACVSICVNGYNDRTKTALSEGYQEAPIPGSHETMWVKSEKHLSNP